LEETLSSLLAIGLAPLGCEIPYFTDEPKLPSYFIPKPESGPYLSGEPYGLSLAEDAPSARAKALAEFYERLCLSNAQVGDRPARWTPQSGRIDPANLAELSAKRDPVRLKTLRESQYRWIGAVVAQTGRKTAVPAQAVIPGFPRDGEAQIVEAVGSSGAALGALGTDGAFERGFFEVVERHAVASYSFRDRLRRRVVGLPPSVLEIEDLLRRYRLEPYVFRLSNRFAAPCVFVVLTDGSGVAPALSISSRAAPTFEDAIRTGLLEALERRRPARVEQTTLKPGDRRVYPWRAIEDLRELEPLLAAAEPEDFVTLPAEPVSAGGVMAKLTQNGEDVLRVDLTLPEVAAAGFEAVKVIAPSLGPLPA